MAAFSFNSINIPEVLKAWSKFTVGKMVITVILACLTYTTYYCRDEIKHAANLYVQKLEGTHVQKSYDPLKGIPSSVSSQNQLVIEGMMREYLSVNPDAIGMMMYEFVPRGEEMLYQGRVLVASVSQSGRNLAERYNAAWLPMGTDAEQVEKVLRGNIFYRPPSDDEEIDDNVKVKTKYNLHLLAKDGIKFMISVPIADASTQVRGYITVFMSSYPQGKEFNELVERLEGEAVEYSRFVER